jgi:hypothetical protein
MTECLEDLPGFESVLELNELAPDDWWQSSSAPMKLQMTPRLWVPLRALFSECGFPLAQSKALIFLCQQMEALALEGVADEDSHFLDVYNRLKGYPSSMSQDAEALASDYEDFIDMAAVDYADALKAGDANVTLSDPDAYRYALAYFALKGVMASRQQLPIRIPKKRSQRNTAMDVDSHRSSSVRSRKPINSWIPDLIKRPVLMATDLLVRRVAEASDEADPVDLLDRALWKELLGETIRQLELEGIELKDRKTIINRFVPGSEDFGREFAVIQFILTYTHTSS